MFLGKLIEKKKYSEIKHKLDKDSPPKITPRQMRYLDFKKEEEKELYYYY